MTDYDRARTQLRQVALLLHNAAGLAHGRTARLELTVAVAEDLAAGCLDACELLEQMPLCAVQIWRESETAAIARRG